MTNSKFIWVLCLSLGFGSLSAQSLLNSQLYNKNLFSLNPAFAGNDGYVTATFQASNQVTTLPDAPNFLYFNSHALLYDNLGVGLNIVRDRMGAFENVVVEGAGSFKALLGDEQALSFGLSVGVLRSRLDEMSLDLNSYVDTTDPVLSSEFFDRSQLKIGTGILYQNKGLDLSIALPKLIRTNSELVFDLIAYAGYSFNTVDEQWTIRPSVMYQAPDDLDGQFDASVLFEYDNKFWWQFGYRDTGSAIFGLGANLDSFGIGYSYGVATGDLNEFISGKHEVLVSLSFGRKRDEGGNILRDKAALMKRGGSKTETGL